MFKAANFLKSKPFFWLLIPVFFLLKNINVYFGLIPVNQLIQLFAQYLLIPLALYFILFLFTGKKSYKAAFYCLLFLTTYFFFTAIDEFVQVQAWLRPFNRYRYFLPFLIICLISAMFFIRRMAGPPVKGILFLNLLLSMFCIIESLQIAYKLISPPKALLGIENKAQLSFSSSVNVAHPDVYFLLFDEYQGNAGLQKNFQYDNATLIQALKNDSFYIPGFSRSNYNFTFFSMPSIFNMSYLKGEIQGRNNLESLLTMASGIKLIQNAAVIDFFKQNKYQIVNLSPFAIEQSGEKISQYRSITFEKDLIATQTIFYSLVKKFAWEIDNKAWLDLTNPLDYYNQYYNKYVEDRLISESAKAPNMGPVFTYAHFFIPHSPFLKDSAGNDISLKYQMQDLPPAIAKSLFLEYVKYCNTGLISMVSNIIKRDPHSIIIIMSDHGLRDKKPTEYNNQFYIRTPGADYAHWPDTVDAVNVFRILFNDQFDQRLEYLPYRQVPFGLAPNPGL
jgi:hypothetical protein